MPVSTTEPTRHIIRSIRRVELSIEAKPSEATRLAADGEVFRCLMCSGHYEDGHITVYHPAHRDEHWTASGEMQRLANLSGLTVKNEEATT